MRRIAAFSTAALLLAASVSSAAADAIRLDAAYSVYLTGLQVGRATVTVELSDAGFSASGNARTSGFIRMISKGSGWMSTRGAFQNNRISSSTFSAGLTTSRREQKLEVNVVNGIAKEFSAEPPLSNPDNRRVPITSEARTNVFDPMSAMLALVAKGDLLSPESCNRSLPIFDGRYRFNLVLSFVRAEKAIRTEGYQGPALVCQVRYVPIAGHHADGENAKQMMENRNMFVWLAPVAGTRALAPIKASIASPIGTFAVEATRFQTSTQ